MFFLDEARGMLRQGVAFFLDEQFLYSDGHVKLARDIRHVTIRASELIVIAKIDVFLTQQILELKSIQPCEVFSSQHTYMP